MTRDVSARLTRLERLQPAASDVQRLPALENVPRQALQRIAEKRILSCAYELMTPSEQAAYTSTRDDSDAAELMTMALVRLSEHCTDLAEPDDPTAFLGWFHAWDSRRSWAPPK